MASRTVRLDADTEKQLEEVIRSTGLTASAVLKQGVRAVHEQLKKRPTAWEVYSRLDLGPGGDAIAPSTEVRSAVREAIRRKLRR